MSTLGQLKNVAALGMASAPVSAPPDWVVQETGCQRRGWETPALGAQAWGALPDVGPPTTA